MRKRYLIVGIIIIVLSLYYAFKDVTVAELANAFKTVQYIYLLPAIFLVGVTFVFRAMRWRYLIGPIKKVKTTHLFSPLMVGFMGNMLPARAGEFIRAYLLGKKENISFSASFATIFIERLFDMALVLLLLVWLLLFRPEIFAFGDTGGNHQLMGYMVKFGWISFIGFLFILLFSALLQFRNDWAMKIVELFTKPLSEKWRERIVRFVHSFTEGLKIVKDKRGFIAVIILSCLIWGAIVFTYYPIYMAFNIDSQLPAITSLITLCLAIAVFITLFPTPGFLGAFQAACVVALHEIFKIPKAVAASYGIVAWLIAMGFVVVGGTFFVLKDHISLSEFSASKERIK